MRKLVLVGGGHAHIEVLRQFAADRPRGVRLTVVLESLFSLYSGMVPGVISGHYSLEDAQIDVAALADAAGARVLGGRLARVEPVSHRLLLEDGSDVAYDVASLNLGSAPAGLDLPGVAARALPVRPMSALLRRIEAPEWAGARPVRILVAGGGAGGAELAFALRRRLPASAIALVEAGSRLLPRASRALAQRVQRRASAACIDVHCGRRAVAVEGDELRLEDGVGLGFDRLVWTAGARAVPALCASDLPRDARGFALVEPTLQVQPHADLFAAGDCATLRGFPDTPKAGVYAVRQGPILGFNLRAFLEGRLLRRYRPQADFLTLVNLGDGSAAGGKWGLAFEGRWVMRLKDRIDRRFIARYRL